MRFPLLAPLGALLVASLAHASVRLPSAPAVSAALGEVLVRLADRSALTVHPGGALAARNPALASALARHGLTSMRALHHEAAGRDVVLRLHSDAPDFDAHAAAADLRAQSGVLAAAPNLHMQLHLVPNDPYLGTQWHLSTSAAAVRARPAWDQHTGSASVVIGIMDSGVDLTHSEMVSKIWTNTGEIPGNGIDDDGNGWQDDVHGWDFGSDDNDPNPEPFYDPIYGIDEAWHGTFVAGIAAAASNNGIGIAGVAWGCRVLPLKVNDTNGDILLSSIVDAFDYAIGKHIAVLNMSMGTNDPAATEFFQLLVNDAFDAGIVVVTSAGNTGTDEPQWPAACDSVLAVAATNSGNARASFSNWGDYVDIAAPGEGMWSCIARNYAYDETSLFYFEYLWGFDGVHAYMYGDGTSFSAPIVAGAAALVRSKYPAMGPRMVMQQLVLNGDVRAYDNIIGPRLNIDRALANPLGVEPAPVAAGLQLAPPSPNPVTGSTHLMFTLARAGRARLEILDAQGRRVRVLADGEHAAGSHACTWDGADAGGRAASAGLYFARLRSDEGSATRRIVVAR